MYTRHDEVPVYEYRAAELEAALYNRVQLALKRRGEPLRLSLPQLKTLDLILQRDAWIIVDRAFGDVPVAAWADFETVGRDALHAPVRCRMRLYHANAGIVLRRTLEALELWVAERLGEGPGGHRVIDFPGSE